MVRILPFHVDGILDYVKDYKIDGLQMADIEDYQSFRNFLYDIQDYKNQGN